MIMRRLLSRNQSGSAAVEFAFAAPVMLLFTVGSIQLGTLFAAYAGMANALNDAARYATTFPTPTDQQIVARISEKKFMVQTAKMTVPTPVRGTANAVPFVDLTIEYQAPMNFVLFTTPSVKLKQTRRAYLN